MVSQRRKHNVKILTLIEEYIFTFIFKFCIGDLFEAINLLVLWACKKPNLAWGQRRELLNEPSQVNIDTHYLSYSQSVQRELTTWVRSSDSFDIKLRNGRFHLFYGWVYIKQGSQMAEEPRWSGDTFLPVVPVFENIYNSQHLYIWKFCTKILSSSFS